MLGRIDGRELGEWMAYERVAGPLGAARHDALFAHLAVVIANSNRGKGQRPYKAEQFMPQWDPEAPPERRPEQSPEEMLRAVKAMHRTMTRGKSTGRAAPSGDAS